MLISTCPATAWARAEVESALVAPRGPWRGGQSSATRHDIKGQGIYCYVTLMNGAWSATDELKKAETAEMRRRTEIGPHRQARR